MLTKLQYENKNYRIRSTLGLNDSVVVGGSEDGRVFVWDLLEGTLLHILQHADDKTSGAERKGTKDVVSAVAFNGARKEWASAGGDGKAIEHNLSIKASYPADGLFALGTVVVWGLAPP